MLFALGLIIGAGIGLFAALLIYASRNRGQDE